MSGFKVRVKAGRRPSDDTFQIYDHEREIDLTPQRLTRAEATRLCWELTELLGTGALGQLLEPADALIPAPSLKCDCGRPLTVCVGCAVEDYQAAHLECPQCCTPAPSSGTPTREQMLEVLNDYDAAADKFIAKVQDGRARSHETYADLRACRAMSKELRARLSAAPAEKE